MLLTLVDLEKISDRYQLLETLSKRTEVKLLGFTVLSVKYSKKHDQLEGFTLVKENQVFTIELQLTDFEGFGFSLFKRWKIVGRSLEHDNDLKETERVLRTFLDPLVKIKKIGHYKTHLRTYVNEDFTDKVFKELERIKDECEEGRTETVPSKSMEDERT